MLEESVYVSAVLPAELVREIDLHIAERRFKDTFAQRRVLVKEKREALTRSSWIKAAVVHYLQHIKSATTKT